MFHVSLDLPGNVAPGGIIPLVSARYGLLVANLHLVSNAAIDRVAHHPWRRNRCPRFLGCPCPLASDRCSIALPS